MNGTKEKSHPRLSSVFTHPLQFAYPNKLFHFLELMGRIRRFTSASSLPCVFVPSTPPNTWYLSVSSFPLRCGNISDMYLKAPAQEYSGGLIERRVRQWRRRNAKEETSFSAQPLIESVSHFARASERARRRLLLMGHDTATSSSHSGGKFANCRQTTTTTTAIRMCTGNWRNPWNLPNNFFRQIYCVSRTTFYMSSIAHTSREMMAVELLPHICPLQNILLHIFASNFWRVSFWWSTTFSSSAGRTYFHTRQVVRSKWPPLI